MEDIYEKLHTWYHKHGRKDLPWRNSEDPYHIYLSEIMLQQTQVKTVLERYYFPFLQKFPTLESLASASLDEVLKSWEGLGYYTRAKNLHRCAQLTAPRLPQSYESLLALPGIGKNTASAICAFAYKQKRAVMEANVRRILCRLYALDDPSYDTLTDYADALLDEENPYDYNQAMMDIGSMICTVKDPMCHTCPFQSICRAHELQCYDFPIKKKKSVPIKHENIVVQMHQKSVRLQRREGRFLHGLWGFVASEKPKGQKIGEVRHQYTHFKLEVNVYLQKISFQTECMFSKDEIEMLALSGVDKKIVKLLTNHL